MLAGKKSGNENVPTMSLSVWLQNKRREDSSLEKLSAPIETEWVKTNLEL